MGQIPPTSGNIKEISEVEELVSLLQNQILNSHIFKIFHKAFKAARHAITDRLILNHMNTELLANNTRKKSQTKLIALQYNSQNAQV